MEHLQSSNESMKTKTKQNDKNKGTRTQSTCHKNIKEGLSIERVWYTISREPSDTAPGSKLSRLCTQRHSIYYSGMIP